MSAVSDIDGLSATLIEEIKELIDDKHHFDRPISVSGGVTISHSLNTNVIKPQLQLIESSITSYDSPFNIYEMLWGVGGIDSLCSPFKTSYQEDLSGAPFIIEEIYWSDQTNLSGKTISGNVTFNNAFNTAVDISHPTHNNAQNLNALEGAPFTIEEIYQGIPTDLSGRLIASGKTFTDAFTGATPLGGPDPPAESHYAYIKLKFTSNMSGGDGGGDSSAGISVILSSSFFPSDFSGALAHESINLLFRNSSDDSFGKRSLQNQNEAVQFDSSSNKLRIGGGYESWIEIAGNPQPNANPFSYIDVSGGYDELYIMFDMPPLSATPTPIAFDPIFEFLPYILPPSASGTYHFSPPNILLPGPYDSLTSINSQYAYVKLKFTRNMSGNAAGYSDGISLTLADSFFSGAALSLHSNYINFLFRKSSDNTFAKRSLQGETGAVQFSSNNNKLSLGGLNLSGWELGDPFSNIDVVNGYDELYIMFSVGEFDATTWYSPPAAEEFISEVEFMPLDITKPKLKRNYNFTPPNTLNSPVINNFWFFENKTRIRFHLNTNRTLFANSKITIKSVGTNLTAFAPGGYRSDFLNNFYIVDASASRLIIPTLSLDNKELTFTLQNNIFKSQEVYIYWKGNSPGTFLNNYVATPQIFSLEHSSELYYKNTFVWNNPNNGKVVPSPNWVLNLSGETKQFAQYQKGITIGQKYGTVNFLSDVFVKGIPLAGGSQGIPDANYIPKRAKTTGPFDVLGFSWNNSSRSFKIKINQTISGGSIIDIQNLSGAEIFNNDNGGNIGESDVIWGAPSDATTNILIDNEYTGSGDILRLKVNDTLATNQEYTMTITSAEIISSSLPQSPQDIRFFFGPDKDFTIENYDYSLETIADYVWTDANKNWWIPLDAISLSQNLVVCGNISGLSLNINGEAAINNTLDVGGSTTLNNTLSVWGDTNISGITTLGDTLVVDTINCSTPAGTIVIGNPLGIVNFLSDITIRGAPITGGGGEGISNNYVSNRGAKEGPYSLKRLMPLDPNRLDSGFEFWFEPNIDLVAEHTIVIESSRAFFNVSGAQSPYNVKHVTSNTDTSYFASGIDWTGTKKITYNLQNGITSAAGNRIELNPVSDFALLGAITFTFRLLKNDIAVVDGDFTITFDPTQGAEGGIGTNNIPYRNTIKSAEANWMIGLDNVEIYKNLHVDGNISGGSLNISGVTILKDTLSVLGNTDISGGDLNVNNNISGGSLGITGATTLSGTIISGGDLNVNNNISGGSLNIRGVTILKDTLSVLGNTDISGSVSISGATTINNTLNVTGAIQMDGVDVINWNGLSPGLLCKLLDSATGAIAIGGTGSVINAAAIDCGAITSTAAITATSLALSTGSIGCGAITSTGAVTASSLALGAGSIGCGSITSASFEFLPSGAVTASSLALGAGSIGCGAITSTGAITATSLALATGSIGCGSITSTGAVTASSLALGAGSIGCGAITSTGPTTLSNTSVGGTLYVDGVLSVGTNKIIKGDGYNNVGMGKEVLLANTTGEYNVATGHQALYSNTTGQYNVANGYQALIFNTIGEYNIATGYQALRTNTGGKQNVATGHTALWSNTTGEYNIATGYQALYYNMTGSNNIATGFEVLKHNTGGSDNIATGYRALMTNATGGNNIAIGYQALYKNTTGSDNIAIGRMAGWNWGGDSENNIAIGYDVRGVGGANNSIWLGNSTHTLYVAGASEFASTLGVTGATSLSSTLSVAGATSLSSTLSVAGATTLSSTLNVTGATTLSSTLNVTGATTLATIVATSLKFTNSSYIVDRFYHSYGTSTHALTSDIRAKTNIKDLNDKDTLDLVNKLEPVSWTYKDDQGQRTKYGFLAQELKEDLPDTTNIKPMANAPTIYKMCDLEIDTSVSGETYSGFLTLPDIQDLSNNYLVEVDKNIYFDFMGDTDQIALVTNIEVDKVYFDISGTNEVISFSHPEDLVNYRPPQNPFGRNLVTEWQGEKLTWEKDDNGIIRAKVLVTGVDLEDMHTVDLTGICALNVSAIQQLSKDKLTLEAKVEEQQKKIDSLESRLLVIEAQLSSS